jgi:hypothetical protein
MKLAQRITGRTRTFAALYREEQNCWQKQERQECRSTPLRASRRHSRRTPSWRRSLRLIRTDLPKATRSMQLAPRITARCLVAWTARQRPRLTAREEVRKAAALFDALLALLVLRRKTHFSRPYTPSSAGFTNSFAGRTTRHMGLNTTMEKHRWIKDLDPF